MATKRDPALEKEAQEWIEAVIGEKFPKGPYDDALKDGILLCKYVILLFILYH
jgi:transgelin